MICWRAVREPVLWIYHCAWNSLNNQQILTNIQSYHFFNISQHVILRSNTSLPTKNMDLNLSIQNCCFFSVLSESKWRTLHFAGNFPELLLTSFNIFIKILGWDNVYWLHLAVITIALHFLTLVMGIEWRIKCRQCFVQVSPVRGEFASDDVQCDSAELEQTCMWIIGLRQ